MVKEALTGNRPLLIGEEWGELRAEEDEFEGLVKAVRIAKALETRRDRSKRQQAPNRLDATVPIQHLAEPGGPVANLLPAFVRLEERSLELGPSGSVVVHRSFHGGLRARRSADPTRRRSTCP